MREERYWEEEKNRLCRLCGNGLETWEHVWEECRSWKKRKGESWQEASGKMLEGDGEGEVWMKEMEKKRNR